MREASKRLVSSSNSSCRVNSEECGADRTRRRSFSAKAALLHFKLTKDACARANGFFSKVEARTPCQENLRLRDAATEAWKQAMRSPPSERCGALHHASLAAEATLKYADSNREPCDISVQLLNQVEATARQYRLATMLVLDALFDHIQQISSHVEIIGSLVQRSPLSASDVRVGSIASV